MNKSKWISVKDRLPNKNIRVWAFYRASATHSDACWNRDGCWFAVHWSDRWSDRMEMQAMSELDADEIKITHWMPLPEPPEKNDE